jgi:hypothetical protein
MITKVGAGACTNTDACAERGRGSCDGLENGIDGQYHT